MKISVVIPLYNKLDYIGRALDSVIAQKRAPCEIIVVDDGSTDGSAEYVAENYSEFVTLYSQVNGGVSSARNKGVDLATTDFVAFLDADDYWYPEHTLRLEQLNELYPNAGLLCTGYEFKAIDKLDIAQNPYFPNKQGLIEDYFLACCNADLPVTASSVCIKTTLLQQIGGFPLGMKMGEDQVVWGKLACLAEIACDGRVSVVYDLGVDNSACDVNSILQPAPQVAVFSDMLKTGMVPAKFYESVEQLLHLSVLSCIKNNLISGDKSTAFDLLLNSNALRWDKYRIAAFVLLLLPAGVTARLYRNVRNIRKS